MKYKVSLAMLTVVLSGLVFFSLFQSLHMSHLYRLETSPIALLSPEDTRSEVVINFRLADRTQSTRPQAELLNYLQEIASTDGVSVVLASSDFSDDEIVWSYFITGDDFFLDPLVGETLDWNNPNETSFMAVDHPENPIHRLANNYLKTDLVLRPWSQIDEHFSTSLGTFSALIYTAGDPNIYLDDPNLYSFADQAKRDESYVNYFDYMLHVKQGNFYSSQSTILIVSITSLLIILVYYLFVSDHRKEIAIRSLNGQSNLRIFHELFMSFNLLLIATWIAPMLLLSLILKAGWNPLSLALYSQLMSASLLYLIGLLLASLIAVFTIRQTGFNSLKQSGIASTTSGIMSGVKLVFLILCIAFIATFWHIAKDYQEIKQHVAMYGNKPMYELMLVSGTNTYGVNQEQLQAASKDYTMYFQTIRIYDRNNLVVGEAPDILYQTVLADTRLTDYADIILLDGSIFKPVSGKKYLLYPPGMDLETYFASPEINQSKDGVELVEIRADQNLMLPHEFGAVYDNYAGFSFFLSDDIDSSLYHNYLIDRRIHPWADVSQQLVERGIPPEVVIPLYKNIGGDIEGMQYDLQLDERNMFISAISLVIAVLITYYFTRIYIDNHRKRLAVAYLFGEPYHKRYSYLLSSWLVTYLLVALFFVSLRHLATALLQLNYSPNMLPSFSYNLPLILKLIAAFFIADGLFSWYFIRRLEIGVVRALKGGEI